MDLSKISGQFNLLGGIKEIRPFGAGHINDTFRIVNNNSLLPDYLLQRINHEVFKEVSMMMDNIWNVTAHLHKKFGNNGFKVITLIPTVDDHLFYRSSAGEYWRVYEFMRGFISYDVPKTLDQIYTGAKAFGIFLHGLADYPVERINVTIPDFHNVIYRLNILKNAVDMDVKGRVSECRKEIKYVWQVAEELSQIEQAGKAGKIPLRVTHSDTKFNNVLLGKGSDAVCVIDLDTVMPGYVHYDYGDGIRTIASIADEDEPDRQKIQVDLERVEAFSNGYMDATGSILTETEMNFMPISGALLAYLMGVRFLTDYLSGDIYYKIHYELQNVRRARAQLNLTKKLLERKKDMAIQIKKLSQK